MKNEIKTIMVHVITDQVNMTIILYHLGCDSWPLI